MLPGRPPVNPEAYRSHLGARASRQHKEWHSRGYLPHFDKPGSIQSITFRLHDAVPAEQVERWRQELNWRKDLKACDPQAAELRRRMERFEDAGHGACYLLRDEIANLVEEALLHFDGQRYRLLAWCIMPNHVHALIETIASYPVGAAVHSWKSYGAKKANKIMGRSGTFWMEDYYDRFIRNDEHLHKAKEYIENNPVKAGLVAAASEWRYSNAGSAGILPARPYLIPYVGQ